MFGSTGDRDAPESAYIGSAARSLMADIVDLSFNDGGSDFDSYAGSYYAGSSDADSEPCSDGGEVLPPRIGREQKVEEKVEEKVEVELSPVDVDQDRAYVDDDGDYEDESVMVDGRDAYADSSGDVRTFEVIFALSYLQQRVIACACSRRSTYFPQTGKERNFPKLPA